MFRIVEGDTVSPNAFATMEYIKHGGQLQAIIESKKEVPESCLDEDGRYIDQSET